MLPRVWEPRRGIRGLAKVLAKSPHFDRIRHAMFIMNLRMEFQKRFSGSVFERAFGAHRVFEGGSNLVFLDSEGPKDVRRCVGCPPTDPGCRDMCQNAN